MVKEPNINNLFRLTKAHIKPTSEMMARAFHDDPGFIYYFPDEYERKKKLPYIFQRFVRHGLSDGEVYAISPNLEGVTIWLPSENNPATEKRQTRSGDLSMSKKLGKKKALQIQSFFSYLHSIREHYAPFRHYFLLGIAVNPCYQGKGYASTLLKAMFERLDREKVPCFLDTQKENNVPIYQHLGFEIVDNSMVPGTEISNWAMLRKPKTIYETQKLY